MSQIIEGNKLIAQFMGGEIQSPTEDFKTGYAFFRTPNYTIQLGHGVEICDLQYHSSWEWLMQVIEKISRIKLQQYENYQDVHYPRTFGMPDELGNWLFRFNCAPVFTGKTLIEAAWNAVVYFCKEIYN